jgi:YD repeat-containing protein
MNPDKQSLSAWADQGMLLWAAHRTGQTPFIRQDLTWNWPVHRSRPGASEDSSPGLIAAASNGRNWNTSWNNCSSAASRARARHFGRLTTYVYDASSKLQRIVDVHGRSTTFVVDVNGNLTKRITPELCITELVYGTGYDDLHQLKAVIAPDGARTSLSYDDNGWCNGIMHPDGQRVSDRRARARRARLPRPISQAGRVNPSGGSGAF